MKQQHNTLKICVKKSSKSSRTPYQNLIDSLKHAYDKIPYLECEHKEYAQGILDH